MPNLWLVFTTGLLTGGITCMAVQGGLLASALIGNNESGIRNNGKVWGTTAFLVAKLVAHIALGFGLGALGSVLTLSLGARAALQGFVAVYMLGVAGAMLDVHPTFRYFLIQPPRFLTRLVRNQSKSKNIFAPALLGALTIFIPCAITQAMAVVALGTGNPLLSAAIMF